jgi:transcriptional regulator with XRE-family HTH domain
VDDDILHRMRLRRRLPPPAARRLIRERAGVSQLDVARVVGVTREAVARWELHDRTPRGTNLDRYLETLDRLATESLK